MARRMQLEPASIPLAGRRLAHQKRELLPFWLLIVLILVGAALLAYSLIRFFPGILGNTLPFAIHSPLQADYSADAAGFSIAPLSLHLVADALGDDSNPAGANQLPTLLNKLNTPVASITPPYNATAAIQATPTITATPTVVSTTPIVTPTAVTASPQFTASFSPTPTRMNTRPALPTRTLAVYTTVPATWAPTQTASPTATTTFTALPIPSATTVPTLPPAYPPPRPTVYPPPP